MQASTTFQKQRPPKHKRQGFDSPAEARQYKRQQYGTNSSRQKSRHNDWMDREPISATQLMREEEKRAKEKRAFNLRDIVTLQIAPGWTDEAEILGAYVVSGKWMYETDCAYKRTISQAELRAMNTASNSKASDEASYLLAERDELLSLKRGSRRRDLRHTA